MKEFQLQFGGIHNNAVLGGLMVAQCTLGIQDTKAVLLFSSLLLFVLSILFFLSSSKSQLLNDVAVAVAGDGTQNPV